METTFMLMLGLCFGGLMEFNMSALHFKGEIFKEAAQKGGQTNEEKVTAAEEILKK
jgi:hypothetical protein